MCSVPPEPSAPASHAIDVLIPAYNAETTIRSAVESICAQTERDILIHVVDDGSTDSTARLLSEMAADDDRIRVHHQPNSGIVDALNFGLGFCTAEFIARHDADDIANPDRLAVQRDWLIRHPEAVAVGAGVRHIDENGTPTGDVVSLVSPDLADPRQVPSQEPYIIHPFLMVRREAVEAVGGYRYVHHAEDTDLYWRLSARGRLHNLPEVLGDYRVHSNSISSASIVNGRIAALHSQLAALSFLRRQRGAPDIAFPKNLDRLHQAKDLAELTRLAGAGLDTDEMRYLEEATAAKLLELASYRPFELEASDCRLIGEIARRGLAHLSPDNAALQARRLSGTAARLAAAGRLSDALALLPAGLLPGFVARTVLRAPVLSGLRKRLKQRSGSRAPSK